MSKTSPGKTRSWPIRIIALLLLLQAVGLAGGNVYNISAQVGEQQNLDAWADSFDAEVSAAEEIGDLSPETLAVVKAFVSGVLLIPLAVPALLAAIGFLFLLRFGWTLAMITQVVALLFCLILYLDFFKPFIIYPVMVYCVLMVLYLNVHDVRLAFLGRRAGQKKEAA
jgi:hypothetical protein